MTPLTLRGMFRVLALCVAVLLFAAACGGTEESAPVVTGSDATGVVESEASDDATADDAMEDDAMADDAMEDDAMEEDAMADGAMEEGVYPIDVAGVTIESRPERIISLSPTATEMLFAIGAGDQVVAVDDYSNFPAAAPVTDLSGFTPNIEAIAGFEPDLIVAQGPIEGADALGIPVIAQFAPADLSGVYTQIEELGAVTGHVGGAAEVVGNMRSDIDAILSENGGSAAGLTYYHELDNTLYSVTSTTFIGAVYAELGLINIADELDADGFGYPQLSEEAILAADPDLIFLADTICCGQDAATVSARPGWDQLRAVQAGNIVELNDDVASRWGPRIVDLVSDVAAAAAQVTPVS